MAGMIIAIASQLNMGEIDKTELKIALKQKDIEFFKSLEEIKEKEKIEIEELKTEPSEALQDREIIEVEQVVIQAPKQALQPVILPTGVEYYRHIVERYDWNANHALIIMGCESGGNPNSVNWNDAKLPGGRESVGLFQIRRLDGRPSHEALKDPEMNIQIAYGLWTASGRRFGSTLGWFNCAKKFGIY